MHGPIRMNIAGRLTKRSWRTRLPEVARLYANENFPRQVVEALRTLGHDVLTTADAGKADQAIPDGEVLEFAVRERRIIVTPNRRDFIRLHRERGDHSRIIVCTVDSDFVGQASRIDRAIADADGMDGRLLRVNRPAFG
jgi:predicted nuclease of predicted toxin-antitoxin system